MGARKAADEKIKTVKMSVTAPALLQWRLTAFAQRSGRDRSELACEFIDQALRRFTFDKEIRKLAPPEMREDEMVA